MIVAPDAKPRLDPVALSDEERSVLEGWSRRRKTAQALAARSRVVLRCAEGGTVGEVARDLGGFAGHGVQVAFPVSGRPVGGSVGRAASWSAQGDHGCAGRAGHHQHVGTAGYGHAVVDRSMASAAGMSQSAESRIWRAFGLKPHAVESWKLSTESAVRGQGP